MNKTIVTCTSIITGGIVLIAYIFIHHLTEVKAMNTERIPTDKFTTCIKTVMNESRQSKKEISARETSDICINMFKKD